MYLDLLFLRNEGGSVFNNNHGWCLWDDSGKFGIGQTS